MTDDAMWDGFAGAVVVLDLVDSRTLLRPEADGEVGVFDFTSPVHIVTAYNPDGLEVDATTNAARHRELMAAVAGFDVIPTVGSAPDGSMPEPGCALLDVSLAAALELGRTFGQRAIYRWTADSLTVIGVDEPYRRRLGWSLSPVDGGVGEHQIG